MFSTRHLVLFIIGSNLSNFVLGRSLFRSSDSSRGLDEVTKLLCLINLERFQPTTTIDGPDHLNSSNTIARLPPIGFHQQLMLTAYERATSWHTQQKTLHNNNPTEIFFPELNPERKSAVGINRYFTMHLTANSYHWISAGEIFLGSILDAETAFKVLMEDPAASKMILDWRFNHFGGSFRIGSGIWSLMFSRGYDSSTLPDCRAFDFQPKFISKITRLRHGLKDLEEEHRILSVRTSEDVGLTSFREYKSYAKPQELVPAPRNSTRASRAARLRKSISNSANNWLQKSRSGASLNGVFDYGAPEVETYPFDLKELICLVNFARSLAKPSVRPLGAHLILMEVARNHTEWMSLYKTLVHTGPGGSSIGERLVEAGFEWKIFAQNTARKWPSFKDVLVAFLNSPEHRENLLNSGVTSIGAWYVPRDHYWTLLFARGQKSDASPPPDCPSTLDTNFILESL